MKIRVDSWFVCRGNDNGRCALRASPVMVYIQCTLSTITLLRLKSGRCYVSSAYATSLSTKNRRNTLGGQDWPKAIRALESVAMNDRNRVGPYCCIFGIVMDRGQRHIKIEQKTGQTYSNNTEVWLSDFLWPFFANYSYEEIMRLVLDVLLSLQESEELATQIQIPLERYYCATDRFSKIQQWKST